MNTLANTTPADLSVMSTAQLKRKLAEGLQMTADGLRVMSAIWNELRKRGEEMEELKAGVARWLPMIAAGSLIPETVVAFASRPKLVQALAALPHDEQKRLVDGGLVEVYDAKTGRNLLPALALSGQVIRLVFPGGGAVASVEQQKEDAGLPSRRTPKKRRTFHLSARRPEVNSPGYVALAACRAMLQIAEGPAKAMIRCSAEFTQVVELCRVALKDELAERRQPLLDPHEDSPAVEAEGLRRAAVYEAAPGLTADEVATRTGEPLAFVLAVLADLADLIVANADGRYRAADADLRTPRFDQKTGRPLYEQGRRQKR